MRSLWNEIHSSLLTHSGSWILDFNNRKMTYLEILLEVESLEKNFSEIDFDNKLFVIDYQGNTINLIILYLLILKKGGCVLLIECTKENLEGIPFFYSIITQDNSCIPFEFDHEIHKTPYGNILIRNDHQDRPLKNTSVVLSSSGTTKVRKYIMHSSDSIMQNIRSNVNSLGISNSHTSIVCLPLYYSYALVAQFFSHLLSGGNLILSSYKFIALNLVSYIKKYDVTNFFITPTLLRTLLAYNVRLGDAGNTLEFISIGGGYVGKTCFLRFAGHFPVPSYYKTYGTSEAGPRVATYKIGYSEREGFEPNYLGVPLENISLEKDAFFATYHQKDIYSLTINTPSVFNGYLNGNEYTGDLSKVLTSDLVYTENEKFYIIGRNSDYFSPFKIWDFEIQDLFFNNISSLLKVNTAMKNDRLFINLVVNSKKEFSKTDFSSILSARMDSGMLDNIEVMLHNESHQFTK
ncbi:acyl-CoA synthetase (AMP-forming)/AMP-acid ligase II [Chryseobacterium sp. 52]|uniref:AMP-binding protein n=1 Tax=Chryseobacterium sp. 52 TaxID=2035213 RepID=UPI000C191BBA|nr:class I adenylate-forming enzyme family protein [Chryseobacterium sp. 52]PIF43654.1 acyl-CoA synthetase (AMP-forming)/AMP-acid ligase II [Chryseobacterium sp. 52]